MNMKLGTALTFYAKFPCEMDELYGEEPGEDAYNALLSRIFDKNEQSKIAILVRQVGEQAEIEVEKLLEICTDKVQEHFQYCGFEFTPVNVRDPWETKWWVWSKVKDSINNKKVQFGITVDTEEKKLKAWSWVWISGGRVQEAELKEIIGFGAQSFKQAGAGWGAGGVHFPPVVFEVPDNEMNCDADLLQENITAPFILITEDKLKKIIELSQRKIGVDPDLQ